MDDYLNVDNQVLTSQIPSDEDIAASLRPPAAESSHFPPKRKMVMINSAAISSKEAQEAVLSISKITIIILILRRHKNPE